MDFVPKVGRESAPIALRKCSFIAAKLSLRLLRLQTRPGRIALVGFVPARLARRHRRNCANDNFIAAQLLTLDAKGVRLIYGGRLIGQLCLGIIGVAHKAQTPQDVTELGPGVIRMTASRRGKVPQGPRRAEV